MKVCPKCGVNHNKTGKFCSRSCANSRTFSEETNKKRSKSNSEAYKNFSEEKRASIKEKIVKSNKAKRKKITYQCKVCSKQIGKNKYGMCQKCFFDSDEFNNVLGHNRNYSRLRVLDSFGQEVLLLSSLEIRYYYYLTSNNIRWIQPKRLLYVDLKGKNRTYRPDFLLVDSAEYIEIKGYMWNEDEIKMKLVIAQHTNKSIKILYKKDLESIGC